MTWRHCCYVVQGTVSLIFIHPNDKAHIIIKNNIKCVEGKVFKM